MVIEQIKWDFLGILKRENKGNTAHRQAGRDGKGRRGRGRGRADRGHAAGGHVGGAQRRKPWEHTLRAWGSWSRKAHAGPASAGRTPRGPSPPASAGRTPRAPLAPRLGREDPESLPRPLQPLCSLFRAMDPARGRGRTTEPPGPEEASQHPARAPPRPARHAPAHVSQGPSGRRVRD